MSVTVVLSCYWFWGKRQKPTQANRAYWLGSLGECHRLPGQNYSPASWGPGPGAGDPSELRLFLCLSLCVNRFVQQLTLFLSVSSILASSLFKKSFFLISSVYTCFFYFIHMARDNLLKIELLTPSTPCPTLLDCSSNTNLNQDFRFQILNHEFQIFKRKNLIGPTWVRWLSLVQSGMARK